ncbi:MAG: DUF2793 domain-containing protein [Pseudomonadota bacterium]
MDATHSLSLPYILPAQAQKHVTHNEALRRLDALVQISVLDRNRTDPPAAPAAGQRHIIASGAAGDWTDQDNSIAAWQDDAWAFFQPNPGWLVWQEDIDALLVWTGAAWIEASSSNTGSGSGGASINPADFVGVNTTADTTNRLAVKSDAVLFSHDDVTPGSGDIRHVLNKASPSESASIVFQTGYSGRAEFGLTQDDNWHVRVSADGSTWQDAIIIDAASAHTGIGTNVPLGPLHVAGHDGGVVIENLHDVGAPWTIATGRPGIFEDHLIIAAGANIGDFSTHQLRLRKDGAPTFTHGIAVADGERVESNTSGGTAYYVPYNGSVGELSFRGPDNLGEATFRIYGFVHDGGFARLDVAAFKALATGARLGINTLSPSTTLHVDGPVRVGRYTMASLPDAASNGEGSIIYVSDDAGGPSLAFSDGTVWRRAADGSALT